MERSFVCWVDDKDNNVCVNLDTVRMVVHGASGCDIFFSDTHKIHIDGAGGVEMLRRIVERATALNGTPIDDLDPPPIFTPTSE
jgi:hypothetical protein